VVLAFPVEVLPAFADRAGFMLVPLCAPETVIGYLLPSVVGLTIYGAACTMSVRSGQPWLWPVAAAAAFPATAATWALMVEQGQRMVC
jgi:hypothetical protein